MRKCAERPIILSDAALAGYNVIAPRCAADAMWVLAQEKADSVSNDNIFWGLGNCPAAWAAALVDI